MKEDDPKVISYFLIKLPSLGRPPQGFPLAGHFQAAGFRQQLSGRGRGNFKTDTGHLASVQGGRRVGEGTNIER